MVRIQRCFLLSAEFLVRYIILYDHDSGHNVTGSQSARTCVGISFYMSQVKHNLRWLRQLIRLRGSERDERSRDGALYGRSYLLRAERACYEGRGHGAA